MIDDAQLSLLWLIFHEAMKDHIANEAPILGDTEGKYRQRCQKAGLKAVAEFIHKSLDR